MHLLGVMELVFGVLNIINGQLIVVDAVGLGDDRIDERAEAEGLLLVSELHARMEDLLELGEVGVGDLGPSVVCVGVVIHRTFGL